MNTFNLNNLLVFLPTLLPETTKPKVYDQIRDKYLKDNLWELQYKFYSKLKEIDISGLLGCNDVVLVHLAREVKEAIELANKLTNSWNRWRGIVPDTPEYNFVTIVTDYHKNALDKIERNWI